MESLPSRIGLPAQRVRAAELCVLVVGSEQRYRAPVHRLRWPRVHIGGEFTRWVRLPGRQACQCRCRMARSIGSWAALVDDPRDYIDLWACDRGSAMKKVPDDATERDIRNSWTGGRSFPTTSA